MNPCSEPWWQIQIPMVSAQQMRDIETRLFTGGMPVAALMEKVGGFIAKRVQALFPVTQCPRVGILVGPGHNGGDALVVARELWFAGYRVLIYQPFERSKPLTTDHALFNRSQLGIPFTTQIDALADCDWLLDGVFGFGLERPLEGKIAATIQTVNQWGKPMVSIDLPSGLHTDTGVVLGTAIQATHTLCLGLWKLAFGQEAALAWVGETELLPFDIPWSCVTAILGDRLPLQRLIPQTVLPTLPLRRSPATHKYKQGHLLLVGGSQTYPGSILLAGLGARASGVGMLTLAVPQSLKQWVVAKLPDAIVVGCPETEQGAIAHLPTDLTLSRFDTIAYGPGVTPEATLTLAQVLASHQPLVLDADGLNLLAQLGVEPLQTRSAPTVLTPHAGEFQRLFPTLQNLLPLTAAQQAAQNSGAIVVRKGACTAIAVPDGQQWINTESTPALGRGGSGDVLTGLMGGLMAQAQRQALPIQPAICGAVWWHAQAGRWAAQQYTPLGVNAETLALSLNPALVQLITDECRTNSGSQNERSRLDSASLDNRPAS